MACAQLSPGGKATRGEQLGGVKTVSIVSTAAALEYIRGTRRGLPLEASRSSIDAFSDGADGADCRPGRLCARCPQPNDARPRSPLTTKAHVNSQRAEGRLRAAEPTGEGSGRFWPPYTRPRRVIF